jgi:Ca2+-transporting ATPase
MSTWTASAPSAEVAVKPPHALSPEETLGFFRTSLAGLGTDEAAARLRDVGANQLPRGRVAGPLELLWGQINNPLVWVLIGSGAIAILMDPHEGLKNGLVILSVVALNTIIGFVQEFRAGKAIEALSRMVPDNANVFRDGKLLSLPASVLVPGDVVQLVSGDKVPADMRLIRSKSLRIEEAALTGEALPVDKNIAALGPSVPLGDRKCMAYGGTLVTYGSGLGVVTHTGAKTELGRINELLNTAANLKTPLTQSLETIGKAIAVAISVLALVILAIGTFRMVSETGMPAWEAFETTLIFSIALAVGAIPEGLPAIVTIALAIGVQRMAARRAVVRKLPSVETLGSTTIICSDKTGTLTKNEMTVTELVTPTFQRFTLSGVGYDRRGELHGADGGHAVPDGVVALLEAGALCNDSSIQWEGDRVEMSGDPTEIALLVAAEKAGVSRKEALVRAPRVDAIPFESENQFMATVHAWEGKYRVLLKGAPEVVLARCRDLSPARTKELGEAVSGLAAKGLRVLALAERIDTTKRDGWTLDDVAGDFVFLGLQAMIDPPREEAIRSIALCRRAGIQVKMITGDHPETAEAIGRQLGLLSSEQPAITGAALGAMTKEELRTAATGANVFARVAPEHKLRLVSALQEEGAVVAMTGDGVNDAPALKQANIGVAMGITGTSVSKEAADIVLADDNFATIAAAVEEGRRVYDNVIKSLAFVLPTNLGLAFILFYAVLFFPFTGSELLVPVLPTQILWINLVGAVTLALPLAFESKERDVMERPPRRPKQPILSRFVVFRTIVVACLTTAASIALFLYQYRTDVAAGQEPFLALANAQTMAATTVVFFQLFYMFNCRSLTDSVLAVGIFSNKTVYVGVGALAVLQAAFIYWEPLQIVFGTAPIAPTDLLIAALVGASVIPVVSVEKLVRSRARRARTNARGHFAEGITKA